MPTQASQRTRRRHVLVLGGYGASIRVDRGRLIVDGEINGEPQTLEFEKVRHGLDSIVIVAQHGSISLAALRWLQGTGVALIQVDRDGRVQASTVRIRAGDGRFRRAQSKAAATSTGVKIARLLITRKIQGQITNLGRLRADTEVATVHLRAAEGATSLDGIRFAESMAAESYWRGWQAVRVRFTHKDEHSVPSRWLRFDQRSSPLASGPRVAVDPVNCIVNYLSGVLEGQARLLCHAIGLDEHLAIIHADAVARSSFVFDLVEPVRPIAEAWVLNLVETHVFSRRDFAELPSGGCRVMPPLRDVLASTGSLWRHHLAPHVEDVAAIIADSAGLPVPPTLLTETRRRTAQVVRRSTTPTRQPTTPRVPRICIECGDPVTGRGKRCQDCRRAANDARLAGHSAAENTRRGRAQTHPAKRPEVRAKIAATQRRNAATRPEPTSGWVGDKTEFERLIRRHLSEVSASYLARETGLSKNYCRLIRDGHATPHVRRWADFHSAAHRWREATKLAQLANEPKAVV